MSLLCSCIDKTDSGTGQLFNGEVPRPMLPVWLRPDALMSKPIMSHAAASNNVVLKITVPKRTGRKRKRGSNEPFSGDLDLGEAERESSSSSQVCSIGRQDRPASLLRKLRDNVGKYEAEAVGSIKESHRYRGLADFQFAVEGFPTVQNIAEHLMPMQGELLFVFLLHMGSFLTGYKMKPPNFEILNSTQVSRPAPGRRFYHHHISRTGWFLSTTSTTRTRLSVPKAWMRMVSP